MALEIALTHRTHYRYDRRVALGPQLVRLRPAPILAYALEIEPRPHFLDWQQDPFGNFLARIALPEKTDRFTVTVDLLAEMAAINPFDFLVDEAAVDWPFAYEASLAGELRPCLEPLPGTPPLDAYLRQIEAWGPTTVELVTGLNRALARDIAYRTRMEEGVQAPEETLGRRSGSCRDSGWLLVQLLRLCGLAARFVSGYLVQLGSDAASADGSDEASADCADLHAWTEVYLPGAGWIGLDPTSGLLAGEGRIPLAATPSPASAAPIAGTHGPAKSIFPSPCRLRACARRRGRAGATARRSGRLCLRRGTPPAGGCRSHLTMRAGHAMATQPSRRPATRRSPRARRWRWRCATAICASSCRR